MTKEVVKKAYDLAEKEIEEKQIEKVKDIVKSTLTRIKELDSEIKELEEEKKLLRLDLEDLKEGRLDRIEERQAKDEKAKKISILKITKEIHHHYNDYWHQPYKITYVPYYPPSITPLVYCGSSGSASFGSANSGLALSTTTTGGAVDATFTCNSSTVKNNVIGTYNLGDKIVHLR